MVPKGLVEPDVDPGRFGSDGAWSVPPAQWAGLVEDRLEADALRGEVRAGIDRLPIFQYLVVTLRDVEGATSQEVCLILSVSEGNQGALLHKDRSSVRRPLAPVLDR